MSMRRRLLITSNKIPPMPSEGIRILGIDGGFYTPNQWNQPNENAVGVAVITNEAKFVIAPKNNSFYSWGGDNKLITDLACFQYSDEAKLDYDGKENTTKIVNQLSGYVDSHGGKGAPAAESCTNYTFKNNKKGYLGSCGEWNIAYLKKSDIESALTKIGADPILSSIYWTSTQRAYNTAWAYSWSNGWSRGTTKDDPGYTRAFCPLG